VRDPDASPLRPPVWQRPRVAVILVDGTIVDGASQQLPFDLGSFAGAATLMSALEECRRDQSIVAVVLRVNSPGGSAYASDVLARAITKVRAAGKPVVVSMGDVAASGGYLAAVRADVIVAQPASITGSIGVFGIWPVATELLESLGVKIERLATGPNAGMYSTFRAPTAAQRQAIDRVLDIIYADFTRQVGEARKLDAAKLDAAARGRVFTGVDAQRAGLIDELGGLHLALDIAKAKAGIDQGQPIRVRRFPAENDRWQKLMDRVLRLASLDAQAPSIRAPREIREALARLGIARQGNVRLPPLPPLWR
jgi:protease IV